MCPHFARWTGRSRIDESFMFHQFVFCFCFWYEVLTPPPPFPLVVSFSPSPPPLFCHPCESIRYYQQQMHPPSRLLVGPPNTLALSFSFHPWFDFTLLFSRALWSMDGQMAVTTVSVTRVETLSYPPFASGFPFSFLYPPFSY